MAIRKTHEQFIKEMDLLNPNIEILDKYVNAKTKLLCNCKIHLYKWYIDPDHLLRGHGCPICAQKVRDSKHKKKTHEQFVKEYYTKFKDSTIDIIGKYKSIIDDVTCKCRVCNAIYEQKARKLMEGVGCPVCAGVRVVKGINDIATTNPDIVQYFKNTEDAYKYTKCSTASTDFKCPVCGYEKFMKINSVVSINHFSCPICSDGISYPNKFSRAFLKQLPVENVKYEYTPLWAKQYSYDNYFEYMGRKYILEMDGAFHYMKYYNSNLSLEDTKQRDKEKDELAKNNNIQMIRINCFYSTKEFIKKNILESDLSIIFDLSNINWEQCDKDACRTLIYDVCNYYNNNKTITVSKISKIFKLREETISKYLYKGNELGICNYHPKNKIPVILKINDNEIYFNTLVECARYLSSNNPSVQYYLILDSLRKRNSSFYDYEFSYVYND